MQSCVKFACWVHLYVWVCVCHDSRLIKLLHSNELWLSVWQLLWQPLLTASPPTHIHTSAQEHACRQHAPTWSRPQLWKGINADTYAWCVLCRFCCCRGSIIGKVVLMQKRIIGGAWGQHTLVPTARATLPLLRPLLCFHPDNDRRLGITVISCFKSLSGQISTTAQRAECVYLHAACLSPPTPSLTNKMDVCV